MKSLPHANAHIALRESSLQESVLRESALQTIQLTDVAILAAAGPVVGAQSSPLSSPSSSSVSQSTKSSLYMAGDDPAAIVFFTVFVAFISH